MALDEPTDKDEQLTVDGYTFVVERSLYHRVSPITVDMSYLGFQVSSPEPLVQTACGASTAC